MREWRKSPIVATVAISLFLLIQLSLPLARLGDVQSAHRFGWQMFSSYQPEIEFTVHTSGGSHVVDLEETAARVRADLALETLVPPHLCKRVADAQRVTWAGHSYQC